MDICIRLLCAEDYQEIHRLWTSAQGVGLRSLDDSEGGICRFIQRNPTTNFAAEHQSKIIGVILCGHDGRRGYIYHACVANAFRNRGTGKRLVAAALTALQEEGINKAALVVFTNNKSGIAFWESIGFYRREDINYYNISLNPENI